MQTQMVAQSGPEDTLVALSEQALSSFDSCFPHIRTLRMTAVGGGNADDGVDLRAAELLSTDLAKLDDHAQSAALVEAVKALIEAADEAGKPDGDSIGAAGMAVFAAHRALVDQARALADAVSAACNAGEDANATPSAMAKIKMRKATDLPISRLMSTLQFRDSLSQRMEHLVKAFGIAHPEQNAAKLWAKMMGAHIASWAETLRDSAQSGHEESESLFESIKSGQLGEGGAMVGTVMELEKMRDALIGAASDLHAAASGSETPKITEMKAKAASAIDEFLRGSAAEMVDRCWMPETAANKSMQTCLIMASNAAAIRGALNELIPVAEQIEALAGDITEPMDGFTMNAEAEAVRDAFQALYTVDVEHAVHSSLNQQL